MDLALVRAAERQMRRAAPADDAAPPSKRARQEEANDDDDATPDAPPPHWLRYAYHADSVAVLTRPSTRAWVVTCPLRRERSASKNVAAALASTAGLGSGALSLVKLGCRCVCLLVAGVEEGKEALPTHVASGATLALIDSGASLAPAERVLPGDAVCAVDAATLTSTTDRVVRACRGPLGLVAGSSFAVMYRKCAPTAPLDRWAVIAAVAAGASTGLGPGARVCLTRPDVGVVVTLVPVGGGGTVAVVGALPSRAVDAAAGGARVASVSGAAEKRQ